jgi:hypothetical protein
MTISFRYVTETGDQRYVTKGAGGPGAGGPKARGARAYAKRLGGYRRGPSLNLERRTMGTRT